MNCSPIFWALRPLGHHFSDMHHWPEQSDLNHLTLLANKPLVTLSGKPVCFVPQIAGKQRAEQKYETCIYQTGQVQTRSGNWHDFFNALVWQTFPLAKSALNHLHYQAQLIESNSKVKTRCALRDAATLFDESGVIVISSQNRLTQLLRAFEWKELFWKQREAVLSFMRFYVFGHGLYEKTMNPYDGMTGKGIIFGVEEDFFNQPLPDQLSYLDRLLQSFLLTGLSTSSDMTPVPLLGYPGWVERNHDEAYYDNEKYFRKCHKSDQVS